MKLTNFDYIIVGAGSAEGGIDAANMLKPALARGELHCIGATTLDEYRKPSPAWELVLDLDALSAADGVSWVWGGSTRPSFLSSCPRAVSAMRPF